MFRISFRSGHARRKVFLYPAKALLPGSIPAIAFVGAALCAICPSSVAAADTLKGELEALATAEGFPIQGLQHIGGEGARDAEGDIVARLRGLLAEYNYVIVASRPGKVEKVMIGAPSESRSMAIDPSPGESKPQAVRRKPPRADRSPRQTSPPAEPRLEDNPGSGPPPPLPP